MKCKYCNHESQMFFCPNCGKVIEYPSFIKDDAKRERQIAEFVLDMVTDANRKRIEVSKLIDNGALAEAIYRKYFEHVTFLQLLCDRPEIKHYFEKDGVNSFESMGDFGHLCMTCECQIAILGTVKAGKSMFINSILGREIASSYPTPETAALTKFRFSPTKDYVKVTFYTDAEWKLLWESVMEATENSYRNNKEDFLSEYSKHNADSLKQQLLNKEDLIFYPRDYEELRKTVSRYTSAQFAEHFFAKEVEIGLTEFNVPKNVVFVDTPGLNDPVKFRSDVTKRYLHSANVILLCISADRATIDSKELKQVAEIFSKIRYARERLYVIGTKYDIPENFINYWNDHTKPEFKKILSAKYFFGDSNIADWRILPVSAWYYNMIQKTVADDGVWDNDELYDSLDTMLTKCLGARNIGKIVDANKDKSTEEVMKIIFNNSVKTLQEKTNVPVVAETLMSGPIAESEDIITKDIKTEYQEIIENVVEVVQDVLKIKSQAFSSNSIQELREKIKILEEELKIRDEEYANKLELITKLTNSLDEISSEIINEIKKQ